MTVRSKHNDLLNYFLHDDKDLSKAYVKKCKKFLKELKIQRLILKKIIIILDYFSFMFPLLLIKFQA